MTSEIQESYPASKQSKPRLDIFDEIHLLTNWDIIEHDGWRLPKTKEPWDWCGLWQTKGCLNSHSHGKKGPEYKDSVYIKKYQKSCFRASCKTCFPKWLGRESNKATRRIEAFEKKSKKRVKHIVVSPPSWDWNLSFKELKKKARKVLDDVGAVGGAMIFHPFRFDRNLRDWHWSPHFHIMGFGWIEGVAELYKKDGWVIKNKGFRESTFGTFWYILSHCGVKQRVHSLVWFGSLSYSKLKVEKEPENDVCPICNVKLKPVYFCGLVGEPPPDGYFEEFVPRDGWFYENTEPQPHFEIVDEKAGINSVQKSKEASRKI